MYSLIIPIYKNAESLPELLAEIALLSTRLNKPLEAVFVIDGSPDKSHEILKKLLPAQVFKSQLILLSRNFGSFAAIKAGLDQASGDFYAVIAADLQEPMTLIDQFFARLETGNYDLAVGQRISRQDPFLSRLSSNIFWSIYRSLVQKEMPKGGVDLFGCNRAFRDDLLKLDESNSSLVGLLFWLGYRRSTVGYHRVTRRYGKSAWTFSKKVRYLSNSLFSFSDLPIRLMTFFGALGLVASLSLGLIVLISKLLGSVEVPGYTATVLIVMFFGGLNSFCLGILGGYIWRTYENTKRRPYAIPMKLEKFN